MTGRDIVELLKYEAARRPDVAALVDRVSDLTDEDIGAVEVPLPWFRNALKVMRDRVRLADYSASLSIEIVYTPDPIGEVWRYTGIDRFMAAKVSRCGSFATTTEIELKYDQMIWCSSDHYWVESFYANGVPPTWFFQSALKISDMTRTKYIESCRARLEKMPEFYDPRDQRAGFRIIRHPN